MVQSRTARCAFQAVSDASYSSMGSHHSRFRPAGPFLSDGHRSSPSALVVRPDRFRTTDVRASALNAWGRRTYVGVLGGRCCPDTTTGDIMGKLDGKVAVITGGATGIGRAAAKRFIEDGAFVFIFGRRQQALDAAVAALGPNARAVKGSVSDEADLDRLYAAVKAERGTLDIVFANAGARSQLALGKITAAHIDETFDTNVKGTIFTVQKALPLMRRGG